jgi:phage tail sheath protein FI
MPRPGVDVEIVDGSPAGSAVLNTGTAFMTGVAERGPVGSAVKVSSLSKYNATFGERSGGSLLNDSVSAFFAEGGGDLYISRIAGPLSVAATGALGTTMTADAKSPGAWGNGVKVDAVAPSLLEKYRTPRASAPMVLTVTYDGAVVERSYSLADTADAIAWAAKHSDYVTLTASGPDNPAVGSTVTLAGGVNDSTVDDASLAAALAAFDAGFGPGQVLAPGLTDHEAHAALCDHADAFRRVCLLDAPDSADPSVLAAAVASLTGHGGVRYAAMFGPWAVYPAEVAPATVVVPYSAVEAGIIARVDRGGNPNAPAAGEDGIARLAVDLAQNYTDAEREALNGVGVDLAKIVYGDVRTYGYRTAAGPLDDNWLWFGNSRTLMAIAWESEAIAESYVLKQIDGRRQIFSRLNKDLRGVCARYFDMGALYGESGSEAFAVITDDSVNTTETIKAGEIHAVVKVRVSPAAEWVVIRIVKVPVDQPVAA